MKKNSTIRCSVCSRTKHVPFTFCLRYGWPMCCNRTMTLIRTTADIEGATVEVIASQLPAREASEP